jgi:hypothetical protein
MGRAPAWLPEEREVAAIAWVRATNNGIEGVEQRGNDFRNKVHNYMKAYSPPDAAGNRYANRGAEAVLDYLRTKVFPNIQKFNDALRTVHASCPTGCNEENIYNMAVAIHSKQTDRMEYRFKDFDSSQWPNFLAWKVLRNTPKFRPPSPKTLAVEAAATAVAAAVMASATTAATATTAASAATTPSFLNHSSSFTEILNGQNSSSSLGDEESEEAEAPSLITQLPFAADNAGPSAANNLVAPAPTPAVSQLPIGVSLTPAVSSLAVSSLLPLSSMDPSRGGRGSMMGRTKAKRELDKDRRLLEKMDELKRIRTIFESQAMEQKCTGKIIQYKQVISVAVNPEDAAIRKKIKRKMFKMIMEEEEEENLDGSEGVNNNNSTL